MGRVLLIVGALVLPAHGAAQTVTATTGAVNGVVADSTNLVLPGVNVSLSGPALMGVSSAVTDNSGAYRFSAVPPGLYRLVFELQGFGTVTREGIQVGLGFTATVSVEMTPGGISENLTVSGAAPVVDVTSAAVATRFDKDKLSTLPGARDFFSIISLAPAVATAKMDVGGSGALNQYTYRSYGIAGNRHEVEGIQVGTGTNFFYPDFDTFEEVSVQAVGNTAEMPSPGSYSKFVVKSGGNEYHGELYSDFQNGSMQGHNIDADQIARGVQGGPGVSAIDSNRIELFRDFHVGMGGFIKKDKLWWYGGYRYTKLSLRFPFLIDATQSPKAPVYTGKATYNLRQQQRLIGYYTFGNREQENYFLGPQPLITANSVPFSEFPVHVWKAEYNGALSNAVYFESRVGQYHSTFPEIPKDASFRFNDAGANSRVGAPNHQQLIINRIMSNAAVTYFKTGWGGSHNFKVGTEVIVDRNFREFVGQPSPCNCVHTLNNGLPTQVQLYVGPNESASGLKAFGLYAQDSWQLHPRLTLSLGVRFSQYQPYLQAQEGPRGEAFAAVDRLLTWRNVGPRLGMSFSLTDDGKTVLKANHGLYHDYPAGGFANSVNPNTSGWSSTYAWADANSNGHWDAGEQGRLIATSGGSAATALDKDLKNSYTRETSLFFEREVFANFGVRTGLVWNKSRQGRATVNINRPLSAYSVPVTITDPGPDGRLGTADDGGTLTAFNLAPEYLTSPVLNLTTNLPVGNSDAYTWEISATRRQSGWWSVMANFSHTWLDDEALGAGTAFTPNALLNTTDGRNKTKVWQAKTTATLNLPWGLRATPVLRHQAGTPFGRSFTQTLNFGPALIRAEPEDTQRKPNVTILDARVEKQFSLRAARLTGFFDVANILNSNAEQDITITSGAQWLRPLNITPPRVARIGAKVQW